MLGVRLPSTPITNGGVSSHRVDLGKAARWKQDRFQQIVHKHPEMVAILIEIMRSSIPSQNTTPCARSGRALGDGDEAAAMLRSERRNRLRE
jgi:hypothetical protein